MTRIFLSIAVAALMTIAANGGADMFALTSPTLIDGKVVPEQHVYNGMGYHGKNLSPELSWTGAPAGTRSFALTVFDPDAPRVGGWWHWLVFDIPSSVTHLPEGAGSGHGMPQDVIQSITDFGPPGYGGPAPPPGKTHRYIFTIYALKTVKLGLSSETAPTAVEAAIKQASLGQATIIGLYGK